MKLNPIQQMIVDTGMLEIKLPVFHGYGSQENEVQIDKGEGFCYHDCTSRCDNDRECDCMCGPVHIPKN